MTLAIPFGRPIKSWHSPALALVLAAMAAEVAHARVEHPSPILLEHMRSCSGVTTGGFLPGLRGYCAHAVLGRYGAPMSFAEAYALAAKPTEYGAARPSMTFDSRTGIVTLSDGRKVGLRPAKPGEPTFAVDARGTRYTLDEPLPSGMTVGVVNDRPALIEGGATPSCPDEFSEVVYVSKSTSRPRIVEVTLPHGWDGDEAALVRELAERVGETVDVRIVRAAPPPCDGEPRVTVTAKHDTLSDRDAFEARIQVGQRST